MKHNFEKRRQKRLEYAKKQAKRNKHKNQLVLVGHQHEKVTGNYLKKVNSTDSIAMYAAYENNNGLADWLYNRFVEAFKKDDISKAMIMSDVLQEYINLSLQQHQFNKQKEHAILLHNVIISSLKSGTAHKLPFTGDEGKMEYEKMITDYEQCLRSYGYTEGEITALVLCKRINNAD